MPKPTPVFQDIKATLIEANEQRTVTNEQVMELNQTFKDMYAMEQQSKLDALEASREASNAIGAQNAGLQAAAQGMAAETEKKSGGFLSKLLGGGLAIAAATALAAVVAGIMAFMKMDVDNIISNIKKLFSISDMADSLGDALMQGGKFFLLMAGLGAGLAAFAIGQGASAIAGGMTATLEYFTGVGWAENIKQNVLTLLSINDAAGGNFSFLIDSAFFAAAMAGLGLGLLAFSIGNITGAAADGVGQAIEKFGGQNFAESIKQNVLTLLSIKDEAGGNLSFLADSAVFAAAMAGLGFGLFAFSIGSATAAAADGVGQAIDYFTQGSWSESIKQNVITLLSISEDLGGSKAFIGESATFLLAMLGISGGLAAFAGASAFTAIVSFFTGDQSQKIKEQVLTLMSISDEIGNGDDPVYKATQFKSALSVIGQGLSDFAGGKFMASLKDAGTAILGFFGLGSESPFEAILGVAKHADGLEKGADAIERLGFSLDKISKMKFEGGGMGLKDLAEDMLNAIPAIETAINGGTVGEGWISSGTQIKGLASPDIKFDEAVENIKKIRIMVGADLQDAQRDRAEAQQVARAGTGNSTTTNITNGGAQAMLLPQASAFPNPEMATILR